jgi:glycosyltransferase involved in cell wall biosynthesis
MRLAIGLILSPGYTPPAEFWLGRPDRNGSPEGYLALIQRIQTGVINQHLPEEKRITGFRQITARKFPTDVARNEACRAVLEGDEDYLLFLDCDMVHPADTVERLLLADKPVITARYHIKKAPFAAVAYVKHRTQEGPHRYAAVHFGRGVFEIERGGAGALLIRRDVLQRIHDRQAAQWDDFHGSTVRDDLPRWVNGYLPAKPIIQWFRYQQGPEQPNDLSVSEDFWFWQQVRETGFKGYCDWDLECQHLAQMPIDSSWNTPFLNQQVSEYTNPAHRDMVLANTIVCGYRDGMFLGDEAHVPEYVVTAGER